MFFRARNIAINKNYKRFDPRSGLDYFQPKRISIERICGVSIYLIIRHSYGAGGQIAIFFYGQQSRVQIDRRIPTISNIRVTLSDTNGRKPGPRPFIAGVRTLRSLYELFRDSGRNAERTGTIAFYYRRGARKRNVDRKSCADQQRSVPDKWFFFFPPCFVVYSVKENRIVVTRNHCRARILNTFDEHFECSIFSRFDNGRFLNINFSVAY